MIDFEVSGSVPSVSTTRFKIVGVGGAGGNILNTLISEGIDPISCIAINTDMQTLQHSRAAYTLRIGTEATKGRGAGADPAIGRAAAEEDAALIRDALHDCDCVFLIGGLGGGTATGALPVIAHMLRELDILTIGFVTRPFLFEGKRRTLIAHHAEELLTKEIDTLVALSNETLLQQTTESACFSETMRVMGHIIGQSVKSITDLITKPGYINVDFADIKTVMRGRGAALIGFASAEGIDRALTAAEQLLSSPFAPIQKIKGAQSALINITASDSLTLTEIHAATSRITDELSPDATIIVGAVIDETAESSLQMSLIITGFEQSQETLMHASRETVQPTHMNHSSFTTQTSVSSGMAYVKQPQSSAHTLQDMLPSLEKKLREQYALHDESLEIPALLRKLVQEQQGHNNR